MDKPSDTQATHEAADGRLFSHAEWVAIAQALRLSARECAIVKLVLNDAKEGTIASRLGISASTVHVHLTRLYGKLNVASRVQLVIRVFNEYRALQQLTAPSGSDPPSEDDT